MPKCPLCEHDLVHHNRNGTHIYVCPECSFIGLEWLNDNDTIELTDYLKHN